MAEKSISLPVVSLAGEKVGTVAVSAEVFGIKDPNIQVVHDAVVVDQANQRQATAKTKKRHDVNGSGIKPWRQKGTGRARAGDRQSPLWVGGGNVFGPDGNQNYKLSQNKKAHKLALKTVLSEKAAKGLIVVDEIKLAKVSTKAFAKDLAALKVAGKVLLVSDDKAIRASGKNVEGVKIVAANNLSVFDVLNCASLVVSKADVKKIEEALK
ncbi:MAG: 50S ribosomal protein L4 [Tenericutes bacterium ADurb.BinA155]|jgi:large subunit ribosomal protein L4|nr:MAG: 50S ribosomal protein L4 [Tenericutes bacterium ADurb.BinA155]